MGGGLALVLGTQRPDAVKAVVPAYGLIPWPDAQPDYSMLDAAVLVHAAEQDDYFTPDAARALEAELDGLGKDVEFHLYPERRPRLLQRGPARGVPPRVGRAVVGPHGGVLPPDAGLSGPGGCTGLVEEYLTLGLRLGRHIDGLVDAYYGPPEPAAGRGRGTGPPTASAWWPRPRPCWPPSMPATRSIRPASGSATEDGAAPARRHWLRAQVVGLLTTARKLAGEHDRLRRRGRGVLRRPTHPGRRGGAGGGAPAPGRGPPGLRTPGRPVGGVARVPRRPRRQAATGHRLAGRGPAGTHPDPVRPARGRAGRLRAGVRPTVVRLQLLPRRPAQPGGGQHRPAGAVHRPRPSGGPRVLSRATTPSTPARRSVWSAAASGGRSPSSWWEPRSACWPRASPIWGSRW